MTRLWAILAALLAFGVCAVPAAAQERALTDVPTGQGLPVIVRAAVLFSDVEAIDENAEAFDATVDIRLQWQDLRLAYPAVETPVGFREDRGAAVADRLAAMWSPDVAIDNLVGESGSESRGLRVYPDGRVEMLWRVTGTFAAPLDVERFPFDRQDLVIELVSRRENADRVQFDFRQDDVAFSRAEPGLDLNGWDLGLVSLTRDPLAGWYGESYSRLRVALQVRRQAGATVPSLFVPLFASLLIPLLAIWLNRIRNGEFEVDAFELTNIVIGGLFAVIALNFTVNSDRSILGSGTNTASLLFGLNYLTLAISLLINVALFRFDAIRVMAGRHVQHEAFLYISWALPVLVGTTAVALMMIAAV